MIPGEILVDGPDLHLNAGRRTATLVVGWAVFNVKARNIAEEL